MTSCLRWGASDVVDDYSMVYGFADGVLRRELREMGGNNVARDWLPI